MPMLSTHSGTASSDSVRRGHRALRHPATATAIATPDTPIHTHSSRGAGSPARPSESIYQCAHPAAVKPTMIATGNHTRYHRRDRKPMAATSTTTAMICSVGGSQPCSNDRPCR